VDDIPLLIADKLFGPNGQLIYEVQGNQGVVGNVVLVNGAPFPRFEVANRKYRFRILNGIRFTSVSTKAQHGSALYHDWD
jgi:FtsP/CotA-like multicopper oxidase with cupredoxin domain